MLGIYITAGYPNADATIEALRILEKSQVDLIELGVPFSDPLADGPVIQKAAFESLQQGMNLDKVFDLFKQSGVKTKTILFSYYNPLFAYGWDKLIQQCLINKISGILIPDLPVDEAEELSTKFKAAGLDLVLLAAITSTEERLKRIYDLSNPFVYLVSRVGITGAGDAGKDQSEKELLDQTIAKLKSFGNKPIALGFGIDSREKVEAAYRQGADMAIIGTKTVTLTEDLKAFENFIASVKS
ncbi:MAG: tryptophan synthase subunit alpha [Cyanobacteria bacterium]|nr:tryptophan synthase subunit alpha [Cyanobacteriota bacterium]MDA1021053.1 tryptophan synthase subunit alpha [Cyanobacteriota bacterium]